MRWPSVLVDFLLLIPFPKLVGGFRLQKSRQFGVFGTGDVAVFVQIVGEELEAFVGGMFVGRGFECFVGHHALQFHFQTDFFFQFLCGPEAHVVEVDGLGTDFLLRLHLAAGEGGGEGSDVS